jgi:hypothetical protein
MPATAARAAGVASLRSGQRRQDLGCGTIRM